MAWPLFTQTLVWKWWQSHFKRISNYKTFVRRPVQTPSGDWWRGLYLRRLWSGLSRIHAICPPQGLCTATRIKLYG